MNQFVRILKMPNYYESKRISNSDLTLIDKSIFHYLHKKDFEPTEPMKVGSAFHLLVLEPEKYENEVAIMPEWNLRTNEGKANKELFEIKNNDKIILKKDDVANFAFMYSNLIKHPEYSNLFESNNIEIEKEIEFEYRGIECRSKLDLINHDLGVIIDLKTINSCERAENSVKYDYARQGAFYQLAVNLEYGITYDVIFVFVEKSFPSLCKFIKFSDDTIERGQNEYNRILDKWLKYVENPNIYLGYNENIIIV